MSNVVLQEEFLSAVRNLADAFCEVSEKWDDNYIDVVDPHAYPFASDFNEMAQEIVRWKNAIEEANEEANVRLENGSAAEQLLNALEDHVSEFLNESAITDEYDERFNIKITLGEKIFSIPLHAELYHNFKSMIQAEIEEG